MKPTLALLRKSHNNRLYNPSLPLQNRAKKSARGEGGGRPREREKKKTLKCPSSKVQISWLLDGKPAFVTGGNNIPPFPFLDSLEGKWRRRNAPKIPLSISPVRHLLFFFEMFHFSFLLFFPTEIFGRREMGNTFACDRGRQR